MTDSNGNEVNAYDYDPYGVILNTGTNSVPNPFQYEGGYFESSTGLIKFGTRYYNPNLGRWTQQDPVGGSLGNPDSLNRYLYVTDDPVNLVDPSGRITNQCIAAILSALVLDGGAFWLLYQLTAIAFGLVIDIPIIGPVIAAFIIMGAFFIAIDVGIFIYNNTIAPNCGLPQVQYLNFGGTG